MIAKASRETGRQDNNNRAKQYLASELFPSFYFILSSFYFILILKKVFGVPIMKL